MIHGGEAARAKRTGAWRSCSRPGLALNRIGFPKPLGLLAAVLGVVLFGAGCGQSAAGRSSASELNSSFGRLAGYVWAGPVRSVAASWTVPGIVAGSPDGHASTWIAAQAPGSPNRGPFIQVGVTEDRIGPTSLGQHPSLYQAFWSATQVGFNPVNLFAVRPGDRISASLKLVAARWHVSIVDSSNGMRDAFVTRDDSRGAFNLAEWLQEDPDQASGARGAYPELAASQFSGLTVDAAPPRYADLDSQWMSVNGRDLAPTALTHDRFTIQKTTLTAAGARYLSAVAGSDQLEESFGQDALQPGSPHQALGSKAAALVRSLAQYAKTLTQSHWPSTAQTSVHNLAAKTAALSNVVQAAERPGWTDSKPWETRYTSAALAVSLQAHFVRRLLHVPEIGTATPDASTS